MSSQLAAQNEGVLDTLKQGSKKKVALQQLLSIILNREVTRQQAKLYLESRYGSQKVDWLQMTHDEIYDLALQARKYKQDNQEKWRLERLARQREAEEREALRRQQQRLRLEMIRRNMTRETMIKLVQESIDKCQKIMLTCEDEAEYLRLKKSADEMKRQLFILQGKFFQEMTLEQLPANQEDIDPQLYKRIEAIKKKKMEEIQLVRQLKLKDEKMNQETIKRKYRQSTNKIQSIFNYYAREEITKASTFEDREAAKDSIDLTNFLKFAKDFNLIKHGSKELSKVFKKHAQNGLWVNCQNFIAIMMELVGIKELTLEKTTEFTDYLNGIANDEAMKKNLHILDKSTSQRYEFYTHSGLTKQDIGDKIKMRRELKKQIKEKAKDQGVIKQQPRRNSVSLPVLVRTNKNSDYSSRRPSNDGSKESPQRKSIRVKYGKEAQNIVISPNKSSKFLSSSNIYEQLESLYDANNEKYIKKIIGTKKLDEDEFLQEMRKGRKKSVF